ncbi:hypothetical protein SDC9_187142 [bioreactor metagenome]|uniref:Uncharacterized protein n=1 Tax=bioreactor metagenome TaxID=1076179 RepID=A0A645HTY4_9ZZZZ
MIMRAIMPPPTITISPNFRKKNYSLLTTGPEKISPMWEQAGIIRRQAMDGSAPKGSLSREMSAPGHCMPPALLQAPTPSLRMDYARDYTLLQ